MQKHNAQGLLFTRGATDRYKNNLDLLPLEEQQLKNYKKEVQDAIRGGFDALHRAYKEGKIRFMINGREVEIQQDLLKQLSKVKPKFWVQGSYAYQTMNRPAQAPQQMDLDLGVYFPMSIVQNQPEVANSLIFQMVDGILKHLAIKKGWYFDDSKNTCTRLVVSKTMHIDVPMYAIPDHKSASLNEDAAAMSGALKAPVELNPDEVYLALRNEENWVQSDPKKVYNWFQGQCAVYARLRNVSRYLKGWRDHTWAKGGPSSITLMACAAIAMEDHIRSGGEDFTSDCAALLAVASRLPTLLQTGVKNPADPDEPNLFPRESIKPDEKEDIINQAQNLKATITSALTSADEANDVVGSFIQVFGTRIPNRPELITPCNSIVQKVKAVPPATHSKPKPDKTMRAG